jgi:putative redox protein
MSFTASATPIAGKLRQEIDVNGRHVITTDEPESLGGTDAAPAPHELLPAMVASCVSTMITLYAHRHGWVLDGLHVEVDYEPDTTPRQLAVRVHLPANLDAEQAARLRRVAETCPVRRAFEAGFVFDEEVLLDVRPKGSDGDNGYGQRTEPGSGCESYE